ncbi:MAG TPA: pyridoxal phosphate-dependent aminotransferase [Thermoanaerobaculia bacterium]|nr:pyridoxal phosphate-dependent aminotransferase [Thermoanaerobaculia bacterium]HQR68783.1 pyridoxal phosphate-dependent aminotransferase [Thermoanaerobaculia bacterium]
MPVRFADRAVSIPVSATLEVLRAALALRERGVDVVDLGPGEPDFHTPEFVKEAAIAAVRANFTKYTDTMGIPELRFAVAEHYRKAWACPWATRNVVVTAGGKQALHTACLALFQEGDEVLVPSPFWVSLPEMVRLAGARPVLVPTSPANGYRVTAADLEKAATPATRGILVNTPNNPTGAVLPEAEVRVIARLASTRGWVALFDECYDRLVFEGSHFSAAALAAEHPESVLVCGSLSKTYALTGWRIGYALGHETTVAMMGRIVSHATTNVCSITQRAALAALTSPGEAEASVHAMLREYARRRAFLIPALDALPGVSCPPPAGAFYAFPDVSSYYGKTLAGIPLTGSIPFAKALLESVAVAVTPGVAFGEDRCIRLSFATSMERLEEGMARIRKALSEIR